MRRRTTQADIARLAGVSQTTVSMVLNERRTGDARISEETRARVAEALRKVGYVPNPVARSLASGRNQLLGVFTFEPLFPTGSHDFYFPFLRGIEEEAERTGHDLLLFTSSTASDGRRSLYGGGNRLDLADGCVLLGRYPDLDGLARLRDEGYPFVFIGRRDIPGSPISFVAPDYARATEQVTASLLELGHREIAFLRSADSAQEPSADRERGYRAAMAAAATPVPPGLVREQVDPDDVDALLGELLGRGITAVLVDQRSMAETIARTAAGRGVGIPRDLSVAVLGGTGGTDGIYGTYGTDGAERGDLDGWSGFCIPRREMGVAAARLLLDRVADPSAEPVHHVIPCVPHPGSTMAPPTRDEAGT